ncbi:unnamed protein product [Staurois parvus]|uniref:Uncharacterized protein n=1 Tax=Staurois parvus TaxID=386267 RepID=A0ABN9ELN0_9NEOB|nr:unnamed protein product [Staurois parvus]
MWGDQRVNCVLCAVLLWGLCVCFTVRSLLCMGLLCKAGADSGEICITRGLSPIGDTW